MLRDDTALWIGAKVQAFSLGMLSTVGPAIVSGVQVTGVEHAMAAAGGLMAGLFVAGQPRGINRSPIDYVINVFQATVAGGMFGPLAANFAASKWAAVGQGLFENFAAGGAVGLLLPLLYGVFVSWRVAFETNPQGALDLLSRMKRILTGKE